MRNILTHGQISGLTNRNKLDNLVEKSYENCRGKESADPVLYAYSALGERVNMVDSTGETEYTYDDRGFSYVYGVDRLSLDRYNGCSGYYLYDPRAST